MNEFSSVFAKVASVGRIVESDKENWYCGTHFLRNGFVGIRNIFVVDGRRISIHCNIFESQCGKPLFRCTAFPLLLSNDYHNNNNVEELYSVVRSKITVVVADCLKGLNLSSKKKWPGTVFFGLTSAEYRKKNAVSDTSSSSTLLTSSSTDVRQPTEETLNLEKLSEITTSKENIYDWVEVSSFGSIVSQSKEYFHNDIPITAGFSSTRNVLCVNEKRVEVTCVISTDKESGLPLFTCKTFENNFSDFQISSCVNTFLRKIQCVGKKHWSGYDFFGLTRFKVKHTLITMNCNKKIATQNSHLTDKLNNIWRRNAGPTRELSCKNYKDKRNSVIHSVVDAASFGDVKG